MGKHFSPAELDRMHQLKAQGITPAEIHRRLAKQRSSSGSAGPDLTTVRRALRGRTFRRSAVETRGRCRSLTPINMRALDTARKRLLKKADGEYEVHWDDIIAAARTPAIHRTTAARRMNEAGYDIKWRTPRLKPSRTEAVDAERMRICGNLKKKRASWWTDTVDAYIDCKDWPIPRSIRGRVHLNRRKVRKHLRKKSEGLKRGFTKTDQRKHRMNLGSNAKLCAAIIGDRVRVWHYLPKTWSSAEAVKLYKNILAPALKRHRGSKRRYTILEDNDPTGWKSTAARAAKASLKITPLEIPAYSPDMNPCDFALWDEVERRMAEQQTPDGETPDGFKARLRRTAKGIPKATVLKMVLAMKRRTQSIYENQGGHIPMD